jgi:hypothetical protein
MTHVGNAFFEPLANRYLGTPTLSKLLGFRLNGGMIKTYQEAGKEITELGLRGFWPSVGENILKQYGRSAGQILKNAGKGLFGVPMKALGSMPQGYLASKLFDQFAESYLHLSPDHWVRQWGSFISFFLPDMVRVGVGSAALSSKPLLKYGGRALTGAGAVLMGTNFTDYIYAKFQVENDYDNSVNHRVFREYSRQPGNWWQSIRHFFVPKVVEAQIRKTNPDLALKVMAKDWENTQAFNKKFEENLLHLFAQGGFYDMSDPAGYQKVDFRKLKKEVKLFSEEKEILKKMNRGEKFSFNRLGIKNQKDQDAELMRLHLFQLQQGAKFLMSIRVRATDWVREVFNENGTLKEGKEKTLLKRLIPDGVPEEKILNTRKAIVLLAHLMGKRELNGTNVRSLVKKIGVTQVKVIEGKTRHLIHNSKPFLIAQALFRDIAYRSKNSQMIQISNQLLHRAKIEFQGSSQLEKEKLKVSMQCLQTPLPSTTPISPQ